MFSRRPYERLYTFILGRPDDGQKAENQEPELF